MITFDSDFFEVMVESEVEMTIETYGEDLRFTFEARDQFGNKWQTEQEVKRGDLRLFGESNANMILGDKIDRLIEEIKSGVH